MKKFLLLLCAIFTFFCSSNVAAYTFNMGSGSVDISGTDSALEMYANVNPAMDDLIFTLSEGVSYSFDFATIGTNETWIDDDDLISGNLTAFIAFDNPDIGQACVETSSAVGWTAFEGYAQGWNVTWNDPVVVDFAVGGQFSIELTDAEYGSYGSSGPAGTADVSAIITLIAEPVPEPATILLVGSGLIGLARFRRKLKKH